MRPEISEMIAIIFTEEELEELREILREWVGEGFTTPPYKPTVQSILDKLAPKQVGLWYRPPYEIKIR